LLNSASVKAFSASPTALSASRARWARGCEGTQPGQLNPPLERDLPDHMMCSATKAVGKKEKREDVRSYGVCLHKFLLGVVEPCFPGDG